jgi:hypothetical protein
MDAQDTHVEDTTTQENTERSANETQEDTHKSDELAENCDNAEVTEPVEDTTEPTD